jgi:LPXTG-motif cell wall-anchored protein
MSSRVRPLRRRTLRWPGALFVAFLALVLGPAHSAAAANYQYWGFWQVANGAWTFAQAGPGQTQPADGAVEGWRFAVDDGAGTRMPRATPTFSQVCGSTPPAVGKKRVAVVIDSGRDVDGDGKTPAPAPRAACAAVPTAATSSDVLAAVATVRVEKSLVCAINAYPASGCGGEVATLTDAQKAADTPVTLPTAAATTAASSPSEPSSGSSAAPWFIGAGALIVVGALVGASRRRRAGV